MDLATALAEAVSLRYDVGVHSRQRRQSQHTVRIEMVLPSGSPPAPPGSARYGPSLGIQVQPEM
jgi:hypothetical protein